MGGGRETSREPHVHAGALHTTHSTAHTQGNLVHDDGKGRRRHRVSLFHVPHSFCFGVQVLLDQSNSDLRLLLCSRPNYGVATACGCIQPGDVGVLLEALKSPRKATSTMVSRK
jgi:hypothetical protein